MSEKNLKEDFSRVNGDELVRKMASLEITEWNYRSEGNSTRHIGPAAQEFQRVFEPGGDDKWISATDPSGIALAAIEVLQKENEQLRQRLAGLEAELGGAVSRGR